MSFIVEVHQPQKKALTASQKTFNRLRKKVETLKIMLGLREQQMDECLCFYLENIEPEKAALVNTLTHLVKILYTYYKRPRTFDKQERKTLKEMISYQLSTILNLSGLNKEDAEICSIFEDIEGVRVDQMHSETANELEEMFSSMGVNIDMSQFDTENMSDEALQKIMEALFQVQEKVGHESTKKPRSKKELERELKAKKLEELQKHGISLLYKQLAKNYHPDLEQNEELKMEKVEIMKKITTAYDNNDLHTLLSLEASRNSENVDMHNTDLTIFNSLLKEQVEALQHKIAVLCLEPKYFPFQRFLEENRDQPISHLNQLLIQFRDEQRYFTSVLDGLNSHEPLEIIREIIHEING